MDIEWDYFLAHASADVAAAEELYDYLGKERRVFLDSRCLILGDDWDAKLAGAQRRALISVVLISKNTASAYYQREEVAAAIALAREAGDRHRVVPLYLNVDPAHPDVPYGLRLKHGISLGVDVDLARAAARLLDLRRTLDGKRAASVERAPKPQVSSKDQSPESLFAEGEAHYLKKDFVAAHKCFLRAAEEDHRTAQVAVGYMDWHGQGCEKNRARAFSWFGYAADRGDANGQFFLALMYSERHIESNDPEDLRQDIRLLRLAAEQGLASAQCRLGVRYLTSNHGVAQDFREAMRWFTEAAVRHNAAACGQISALFSTGLGVREDPVLAAKWQRWKDEQRARDRSEPVPLPWSEKPIKWPDRGPSPPRG